MKTGYGGIVGLALAFCAGCESKSETGDEIDSRPGEEKTSAQSEQRSNNRLTALVKSPANDKVDCPDLSDPEVLQKIIGKALLWDTFDRRESEGENLLCAPGGKSPYTGWIKKMHDNGKVETVFYYKDGKWEGPYVTWHHTGEKAMEGTAKDGKREGEETSWHLNGEKASEHAYKDGELDGLTTHWNYNGEKKEEATFKDGKREGLMTVWDEDGKLMSQTRFKNGVEIVERSSYG